MKKISNLSTYVRTVRPILAGLGVGLCFIWAQSAFAANAQRIAKQAKTCDVAIQYQERRLGIPKGLLSAISLAESGRWNEANGATIAWPWTVTTGGKGYFLPNRMDAIAYVKSLQADGVKNIDVGCLQINLKYHPGAFVSIAQAFDANANAAYAANFLAERFALSKSWIKAAGDYHSTTPALNKTYRKRVAKLWNSTLQSAPKKRVVLTKRPLTKLPNMALAERFNTAFRARTDANMMTRPGLAIANRVNALKPGASIRRSKAESRVSSFAKKRQSQLLAWRQLNTPQVTMPVVPAPISVQ